MAAERADAVRAMFDADWTEADAVREMEQTRQVRPERDAALTPAQRLLEVHGLCRRLASIEFVDAET